ncbi:MAG: hypothetical protein ACQEVA_07335, partial [Myxococcota bacterium]
MLSLVIAPGCKFDDPGGTGPNNGDSADADVIDDMDGAVDVAEDATEDATDDAIDTEDDATDAADA